MISRSFRSWKYKLSVSLLSMLSLIIGIDIASAQVTEDPRLSASENTQVTEVDFLTPDSGVYEITGGAIRGSNENLLFHSFASFSIKDGRTAFFIHEPNVETILSRVTGGTASQIDGIITAGIDGKPGTGNADIFIINPWGISFGEEATLDIRGSFIASTAEQITFAEGTEFSATNPQPLLTISQATGLSLENFLGEIVNKSTVFNSSLNYLVGLEVLPRESIILVGNGISLGGGITSPSGRIEMASLDERSSVNIYYSDDTRSGWALDYGDENYALRDIEFSSGAFVVGTDFGNSSNSYIRIRGEQISLNNSRIFANNYGIEGGDVVLSASERLTLNTSNISASNYGIEGGDIVLSASERLTLNTSNISANNYGRGQSGDVALSASEQLRLSNQSLILASTFSQGDGGNLSINVSNGTVELLDNSRLVAQSERDATGTAGNLTITAENLNVRRGSGVSIARLGNGQGGNLVINTLGGLVEVSGVSLDSRGNVTRSELAATTVGFRDAGEIQINTSTLSVSGGGQIRAETRGIRNGGPVTISATESVVVTGQSGNRPSRIFSTTVPLTEGNYPLATGDAGPVTISTRSLKVEDGALIFTTSNGAGQGGDLTVEAHEVILSGQNSSGDQRSGLYARARDAGDSGTVNLTTNTLRIENGARLTVSNRDIDGRLPENPPAQGFGTVRDANITAQSILLNNGEITAESLSGDGGNLNLNVQDFILLRNNSLISASAGTAQAGNGGNVNINIPDGFIIAVPNENSDIIANAIFNTGGNINITSQDIIGLATRTDTSIKVRDNITNDIEASSQFGNDGTVSLNNLGLDPAQGLVELPTNTVAPNPIAQGCLADSEGRSNFVITGQGGTAPNPGDVIRNEATGWVDLGPPATSVSRGERQPIPTASNTPATEPILVEAQGWQRDSNGQVTLIAQLPSAQAPSSPQYSSCAYQSRS